LRAQRAGDDDDHVHKRRRWNRYKVYARGRQYNSTTVSKQSRNIEQFMITRHIYFMRHQIGSARTIFRSRRPEGALPRITPQLAHLPVDIVPLLKDSPVWLSIAIVGARDCLHRVGTDSDSIACWGLRGRGSKSACDHLVCDLNHLLLDLHNQRIGEAAPTYLAGSISTGFLFNQSARGRHVCIRATHFYTLHRLHCNTISLLTITD
jgi:hypothetical protein